jgi:hypothetical protein
MFFGKLQIKIDMKKILMILSTLFLLLSCGSYVNVSAQPRITHILAINELGQEVQVPLSTFSTGLDPHYYHNWRFYWGNTWYWGYNWWFYFNDPYWRPRIYRYYHHHRDYYNIGYRSYRNSGYRGEVRPNFQQQNTPRTREYQPNTPRTREYQPSTPRVRENSSSPRRG